MFREPLYLYTLFDQFLCFYCFYPGIFPYDWYCMFFYLLFIYFYFCFSSLYFHSCKQVRPWAVAKAWEDLVMEEFFEQGDFEKELGMVPDGLFDREKCKVPNSQCWFYENMGKPLYEAMKHHVPETTQQLLDVLNENVKKWKAMC